MQHCGSDTRPTRTPSLLRFLMHTKNRQITIRMPFRSRAELERKQVSIYRLWRFRFPPSHLFGLSTTQHQRTSDHPASISQLLTLIMEFQLMAKFLASLVAAWVFARVLARRNYPQDASVTPGSPPPVLYSWIPYIGHIYHIATKGSNLYFSSLW
ncbi:uncharacterized protein LY79DRAFT_120900 [Colletotrichum navitas]|uniref:Uncharacterized protein n=1 Tax=Colletotrichum navitas TaxID=681940 RepID=A0AAD8PJH2_9PEZI|nr:uncharacterized protein LY79DRAFT_120900 [Colletotrichum navitas]KAK1565927.1 hypothetical protein LY79DRAFT_120900 [Colletotrichum navitas]